MRIAVCLLLLATIVLPACSRQAAIRWAPSSAYKLSIADNPAAHRFDVRLGSSTSDDLCISVQSWPTSPKLPLGFDGAIVKAGAEEHQLVGTGSMYCPGGCGHIRIAPGGSVDGSIPYDAFEDPKSIEVDSHRQLIFSVHPTVCAR